VGCLSPLACAVNASPLALTIPGGLWE
jgi:hypothetical protein